MEAEYSHRISTLEFEVSQLKAELLAKSIIKPTDSLYMNDTVPSGGVSTPPEKT